VSEQRLCLLSVHAHPDDEASKGAPTVARYRDEGVRTVLVCCTGGEAGDILNPAMDRPEVRDHIAEVRREELRQAADHIGYDEVVMLGYRDSGMPGTPHNDHPDCFARAHYDEAVGRLVAVIRRERPQVILTYGDDHRGYPHPDHIRVHDISIDAFDAAADPERYSWAGPPWEPAKLYYNVWSSKRFERMHNKFIELGMESPFQERFERFRRRPNQDHRITTSVIIAEYAHVRRKALLAHATQVDPTSVFWFGLPEDADREIYVEEDYVLARSRVQTAFPEDDLFAGVR